MKLFLSFIYTNLVDERAAAERVTLAMGQQFVGMEYSFAREEMLLETCIAEGEKSQMLVARRRAGVSP